MKLYFTKEAIKKAKGSHYRYPEFVLENANKPLKMTATIKVEGCPVYWEIGKDIEFKK